MLNVTLPWLTSLLTRSAGLMYTADGMTGPPASRASETLTADGLTGPYSHSARAVTRLTGQTDPPDRSAMDYLHFF